MSSAMTIKWYRTTGNLSRGTTALDGRLVYVVLTRYVFGWQWAIETYHGTWVGGSHVYFEERKAAERDAVRWMEKKEKVK